MRRDSTPSGFLDWVCIKINHIICHAYSFLVISVLQCSRRVSLANVLIDFPECSCCVYKLCLQKKLAQSQGGAYDFLLALDLHLKPKNGGVDLRFRILGMSEHEVAAQRIFHSFRHVLATMEQSSLLEDYNPSLLRLNVYKSFFVSKILENPCSTTFHFFIT